MEEDPNSERARKVDERIFVLLSMVEDQKTAVRAGLEGLALEPAELAKERVALGEKAERIELLADKLSGTIQQAIPEVAKAASKAAALAVNGALSQTATTAIEAAEIAAKPTLDGVTAAVKSAAAVQLELKQAVKDFRREWKLSVGLAVMGLILAAGLISGVSLWLEAVSIDSLLSQETKLTAEVRALQEQAEQVKRNNGRKPAK